MERKAQRLDKATYHSADMLLDLIGWDTAIALQELPAFSELVLVLKLDWLVAFGLQPRLFGLDFGHPASRCGQMRRFTGGRPRLVTDNRNCSKNIWQKLLQMMPESTCSES